MADLQDQAEAREDAHNERVEALQATIQRLSSEAEAAAEERIQELDAKCAQLEEQVAQIHNTSTKRRQVGRDCFQRLQCGYAEG